MKKLIMVLALLAFTTNIYAGHHKSEGKSKHHGAQQKQPAKQAGDQASGTPETPSSGTTTGGTTGSTGY